MIIVSIPVRDEKSLEAARRALDTPLVDLVELRLDYLGDVNRALMVLEEAASRGLLGKAVVTYRAWWEWGASKAKDEDRIRVLQAALERGAYAVDVELLTLERLGVRPGLDWSRVVLSLHSSQDEYNDGVALQLLRECKALGCKTAKLALKGREEWLREKLLWFLSEAARLGVEAAAMPVDCCTWLRLALYATGSTLLYACLAEDECTAGGQPVLSRDTDRSLVECAKRLRTLRSLES